MRRKRHFEHWHADSPFRIPHSLHQSVITTFTFKHSAKHVFGERRRASGTTRGTRICPQLYVCDTYMIHLCMWVKMEYLRKTKMESSKRHIWSRFQKTWSIFPKFRWKKEKKALAWRPFSLEKEKKVLAALSLSSPSLRLSPPSTPLMLLSYWCWWCWWQWWQLRWSPLTFQPNLLQAQCVASAQSALKKEWTLGP